MGIIVDWQLHIVRRVRYTGALLLPDPLPIRPAQPPLGGQALQAERLNPRYVLGVADERRDRKLALAAFAEF